MYYMFAVAFGLCMGPAIGCILIAQNGTLTVINKRTVDKGHKMATLPRTAWNMNIVLLLLFEIQATMDHNITSAFAVRPVLGSWQTLIGLPT